MQCRGTAVNNDRESVNILALFEGQSYNYFTGVTYSCSENIQNRSQHTTWRHDIQHEDSPHYRVNCNHYQKLQSVQQNVRLRIIFLCYAYFY